MVDPQQHGDVRWTLRERGVTLAGPDARDLVCEVPADALRHRMSQLESFLPDLFTCTSFDIAWAQRYAVTTPCPILYTLDTGEVASNRPPGMAKNALDPGWHGLIQQVLDDRALGWDPADPPRPGGVEATTRFAHTRKNTLPNRGWA